MDTPSVPPSMARDNRALAGRVRLGTSSHVELRRGGREAAIGAAASAYGAVGPDMFPVSNGRRSHSQAAHPQYPQTERQAHKQRPSSSQRRTPHTDRPRSSSGASNSSSSRRRSRSRSRDGTRQEAAGRGAGGKSRYDVRGHERADSSRQPQTDRPRSSSSSRRRSASRERHTRSVITTQSAASGAPPSNAFDPGSPLPRGMATPAAPPPTNHSSISAEGNDAEEGAGGSRGRGKKRPKSSSSKRRSRRSSRGRSSGGKAKVYARLEEDPETPPQPRIKRMSFFGISIGQPTDDEDSSKRQRQGSRPSSVSRRAFQSYQATKDSARRANALGKRHTWASRQLAVLAALQSRGMPFVLAVVLVVALVLGSASLAAYSFASGGGWGSGQTRPNIVLITVDGMGKEGSGYLNPKAYTPHMDKLSASGVRLAAHHSGPTPLAARVALFTAMQAHRLGGGHAETVPLDVPWALDRTVPLLPSALSKAGYQTLCAGAWGLGSFTPKHMPLSRGCDSFVGSMGVRGGLYSHKEAGSVWDNGGDGKSGSSKRDKEDGDGDDGEDGDGGEEGAYDWWGGWYQNTTASGTYALTAISEGVQMLLSSFAATNVAQKPFLLIVNVPDPTTIEPPYRYLQKLRNARGSSSDTLDARLAGFTAVDTLVGNIWDAVTSVAQARQNEATYLFVTGNYGKPNEVDYGYSFSAQRGAEGSVYEGSLNVPAFVYSSTLPRKSRGSTLTMATTAADIGATIAALSGASLVSSPDGADISSALHNGGRASSSLASRSHVLALDVVYGGEDEDSGDIVSAAALVGNYKLVVSGQLEIGYAKLYDLSSDIYESKNVLSSTSSSSSSTYSETASSLLSSLSSAAASAPSQFVAEAPWQGDEYFCADCSTGCPETLSSGDRGWVPFYRASGTYVDNCDDGDGGEDDDEGGDGDDDDEDERSGDNEDMDEEGDEGMD